MSRVTVDSNNLTDIADAIREKNNTGDGYRPCEMADAIREISCHSHESGSFTPSSSASAISITSEMAPPLVFHFRLKNQSHTPTNSRASGGCIALSGDGAVTLKTTEKSSSSLLNSASVDMASASYDSDSQKITFNVYPGAFFYTSSEYIYTITEEER